MATKVFDSTRLIKLPKVSGIYQAAYIGNDTGLLHFRVDWSAIPIPPAITQLRINVQLRTPDHKIIAPAHTGGCVYTDTSIECSASKSNKVAFLPFQLRRLLPVPRVAANFDVIISDANSGTVLHTDNVSIN